MRLALALAALVLATAPAMAQKAGAKLYREPDKLIATPPERASPSVEEFIRSLEQKYGDDLYGGPGALEGENLRGLGMTERCRAILNPQPNMTDRERIRAENAYRDACLVVTAGRRTGRGE